MPKRIPPDLAIILSFIRDGQGVSQTRLSELSGVPATMINDYEQGRRPLTRERLEFLLSFLGIFPERIDATLNCLESNRASSQAPREATAYLSASQRRIETVVHQVGSVAMDFTRGLLRLMTVEGEGLQAREKAEALWARLKKRPHEERLAFVEDSRKFRTWALCERVAAESIEEAGNDPKEALRLALLAVRIAELCPGPEAWRWRLAGYAWIHLANAHRVSGSLPEARQAMARGKKLWESGASADPGLLNEALVLQIQANLLHAERCFSEAMKLIEEALQIDGSGISASLFYTKARILEGMDNLQESTAALERAAALVDARREPRLALGIRVQLLVNLCLQDRAAEARPRLREVRLIAEGLGKQLDLTRVLWLEAMVAAGTGQPAEAEAAYEQVRRELTPEVPYDYALATLDLSVLLLEEKRTRDVHSLAVDLTWIFRSQQVPENALAALRLFQEADQRDALTSELAREIRRFLYLAQHDPGLKLEKAGTRG
jgi:transcriptional regulator with XRE-family HTH domain